MALTYPLSLSSFFGGLAMVQWTFTLTQSVEASETGGGEILTMEHGPRLWEGTVTLNTRSHADAEEVNALVEHLFSPEVSFLAFPPHRATALAAGTVSDQRNKKEIRIAGLPSGTVLRRGQYVSWQYGSNPSRYALHRLLEPATASSTGLTGWAQVEPKIRDGLSNGTAAVLGKPLCKAKAVPGSLTPSGHRPLVSSGASFAWRQTLR